MREEEKGAKGIFDQSQRITSVIGGF